MGFWPEFLRHNFPGRLIKIASVCLLTFSMSSSFECCFYAETRSTFVRNWTHEKLAFGFLRKRTCWSLGSSRANLFIAKQRKNTNKNKTYFPFRASCREFVHWQCFWIWARWAPVEFPPTSDRSGPAHFSVHVSCNRPAEEINKQNTKISTKQ